ncbi:MAG: metallophosphoesterase [Clostridiales bacterium]|nr:metallophosphoesterase [Clostridiales bacterium]
MPDFKITRYRIRIEENQRGPETPFTAVFLSDLHNASYGENNSRLLKEIRNENPEIVLIAGDMLTSAKEPQMDAALSLMNELTKKYPVYYANGNHESRLKMNTDIYGECYEDYATAIRSCGVHLLENTCEQLEIHRMPVTIWGLETPLEYYGRFHGKELMAEQIEGILGKPIAPGYHLLLAHHPAWFDAYVAWGADLTLSGHLHGGIVRLPLLGGVISPQFRLFPKYDRGLFTQNGKKMVVSAGLGGHTINVRVNNPPELIVLDFAGKVSS